MTDKLIEIELIDDNGSESPLLFQYDGQCLPQRAFLYFNPSDSGPLSLYAEYTSDVGNGGMPASIFNGTKLRFLVPSYVLRDTLDNLQYDDGLASQLNTIRSGYTECWCGDWKGKYNDGALDAIACVEYMASNLE